MPTPLTTWARNHTYRAARVHAPRTLEELQAAVAAEPRVRAVGSRHSFNDLVDTDALVRLDALPTSVDVDAAARTVRVAGPVRYGDLAPVLDAAGFALHTMASLPHISVAGAVATATHGSGDRTRNLAAVVRGLELVTGDGHLREIGADDPDLPGAVVGLGSIGVVHAVTLAVEPTYEVAQEVHLDVPWDDVLTHLDEVTGSATSVSLFTDYAGPTVAQVWRKSRLDAGWRPGERVLGVAPADHAVHPIDGGDATSATQQLGVPGPWHARLPHFRMEFTPSHGAEIQSEYLVPREHAVAALTALRALGPRLAELLLVAEVRTVAADDLWLSTASGRDSVALHFTWQQRTEDLAALLPVVEAALAPFDPRPHWGKVFTLEGAGAPDALARLYPRLDDFRALAARFDPAGRFAGDLVRRHGLLPA
ncbi:D-arabinono-1,4-lactone oxidase [Cellulomonas endophytica]|uniref:D-arabinono-1,4-lactone oxidase n=1 Tax=Cellulomonas endophytica TaxID=2494735 RepID=UPI00101177A8|nr:D-arabinono-1,4-lactone oxidase [Cellulomonas endophytica]